MRFQNLFAALAALPSLASAANKSKFRDLAEQSKDGIIKLDSALYEELLAPEAIPGGARGRDYAVAVVLTALPVQMQCEPCRKFDPIFREEAASWKRTPKETRDDLFFGVLDFADGQQVFQKVSTALRVYRTSAELPMFGTARTSDSTQSAIPQSDNRTAQDSASAGDDYI